jgi:hypothetical protein
MAEQTDAPAAPRRPEVLLALIEHGSRPAALLLIGLAIMGWLFAVRKPVFELLTRAQDVKVGSFEFRLRVDAASANLSAELTRLRELSQEQLQLFLVVGRERAEIQYRGPEATEANLRALEKAGLLSEVRREGDGTLFWRVSQTGHVLHELIFSQLLLSIRRSGAT